MSLPTSLYPFVKRGFDMIASAAGLVITSPVLFTVASAVKLDSVGPVFYRQLRVGRHGRPFRIWKFRTMVQDADRLGPRITAGGDSRVTRAGRVLRRTKLHELPQLFNVLVGEMSLVGPRPEVPEYVEMFAGEYREILDVRPGITDEASILYRDEEVVLGSAEDPVRKYTEDVLPRKIRLYQDYVRNLSPLRDGSILVRTLWKVLAP